MATLDNPIHAPDPGTVSPWPVSLRYGGIVSVILIIIGLAAHLTGISDPAHPSAASQVLSCLNYVVMIVAVVMAIKYHRDKELGGYITLGRGFSVGTLTGIVIGVINAIWMIVFMYLIAPDLANIIREAAMENMQPGQEEIAGKWVSMFTSPAFLAGIVLITSIVIGMLTGLIAGAIVKKEAPVV